MIMCTYLSHKVLSIFFFAHMTDHTIHGLAHFTLKSFNSFINIVLLSTAHHDLGTILSQVLSYAQPYTVENTRSC